MKAPRMPSPGRDQIQYLRTRLAHRETQLEHVRSERDTHFVQEKELLAHMRLLSREAKDWTSRVVSEAEQVLVKESAEAAHKANEIQETMDKQFQTCWSQAEAQLRDMYESNSAQVQQRVQSLHKSELERQQLHIANERRLQLEAQTLRMSQDTEQQTLSIAHEREVEAQQLQDKSTAQPQLLKERWKQQVSQMATYKAEIHALRTELTNMTEKSELQATRSAKMGSVEIEYEEENA